LVITCSIRQARTASCSLRRSVWSGDRKMLRATCWVMVEHVGPGGAQHADHIDARMAVEASILGGQKRFGDIGGHLVEADRLAAPRPARGDHLPAAVQKGDAGRLIQRPQRRLVGQGRQI
jgi:hypothetical protein